METSRMNTTQRTTSARLTHIVVLLGLFFCLPSSHALENGVGRTPAMGWNPWNTFLGKVNLGLLKETIDSMVSNGMRDAGYNYICADGGGGSLMYGPEDSIRAFINYGHSKGFKVGIYCYSAKTREPAQVAKWAGWGFDYLKHDDYRTDWIDPTFVAMRNALKTCGRPVYYTIHSSDALPKPERPDTLCNAMRVSNDISWKADSMYWGWSTVTGDGVMGEVMASRKYQHLARPGYFNDGHDGCRHAPFSDNRRGKDPFRSVVHYEFNPP
jgi:alpha-galactosidase